jgi:hypothetical protein
MAGTVQGSPYINPAVSSLAPGHSIALQVCTVQESIERLEKLYARNLLRSF